MKFLEGFSQFDDDLNEIKELFQTYVDAFNIEPIKEFGTYYDFRAGETGDSFENKFLKFVCKIEEICKRLTEMTGYYATPSRNPYYNIYSEKKSYWSIRIDTKI